MAFQGEIGRASVVVEADVSQFARGLAGLKSFVAQQTAAFGQATASTAKFNSTLNLSAGAVGVLTGALGGLAAAFSVREILSWINSFQNVENAMRAAGVASENLADSTKQLFDVAVATRAPVETMGNLYTQLTLQTKELGLAQKDIFGLMKLVGQGIAVSGTSAEAARGAMLQFGQMLGTSRIRMQEFNSVQMGAPALLRAAAAGIDKAGGSVARLRELVSAGKISNQDFYAGLLKGGATITEAFARMVPTLAQAGVSFRDALIEIAGRTDEAAGGTRALALAIIDLGAAMRTDKFQGFMADAVGVARWVGTNIVHEFQFSADVIKKIFTGDIPGAVEAMAQEMIFEVKRVKAQIDKIGVAEFKGPKLLTQLPVAGGIGGTGVPAVSAEDARAMEAVDKQTQSLKNKLILAKLPAGELKDALASLGADVDLSQVIDQAGNLKDAFKDGLPILEQFKLELEGLQTPEALAASLAATTAQIATLKVEYQAATGAAKALIGVKIGELETEQLRTLQAQAKATEKAFHDTFAATRSQALQAVTIEPVELKIVGGDEQTRAAAKVVADLAAEIKQKQQAGAFDIELKVKTEELAAAEKKLQAVGDKSQLGLGRETVLRMNTEELDAAKQDLANLQETLANLQEAGVGDVRLQVIVEGIDAATAKIKALGIERDRLLKAPPTASRGVEAAQANVDKLASDVKRLQAAGGLDVELQAKTDQLDVATQKLMDLREAAAEPVTITPAISIDEATRQTAILQAAIAKVFDGFTGESGMAFGEFSKQMRAAVATAPAEVQAKVEGIIKRLQALGVQALSTQADMESLLKTGLSSEQVARFNMQLAALQSQLKAAQAPAGTAGDAMRELAAATQIFIERAGKPITIEAFQAILAGADSADKKLAESSLSMARTQGQIGKATGLEELRRKTALARDELVLFDATMVGEGEAMTEAQRRAKAFADALGAAGLTQAEFARLSPNSALRREVEALAAVNLALLDHAEANRVAAAAAQHAAEAMEHEGSAAQLEAKRLNDARRPANAPPPSPPLPVAKPLGAAADASIEQQNALMKQQLPLLQVQADLGDEQAKRDIERINRLMEINRLVALGQQGQPGGITEAQAVPLRRDVLQQGEEQNAQQKADQARIEQGGALPDKIDAANIAAQNLSQTLVDIDNLSMDSLKETFANIAKQIAQMIIQALIFRAIMGAVGGGAGAPAPAAGGGGGGMFGFAKGGVIDRGRIIPAAHGMVLRRPTLIPLASGDTVLAREAGPEAILPLGRTAGGDLGVKTIGARGAQQGQTMAAGDTLNFDFRGMSQGAVADAMNQVYAAARRDVFKELSRSPTARRSIGLRSGR